MKKKIAIALYAAYSVALVLIISFGTSVGERIIEDLQEYARRRNIKDVVIELDDSEPLAINGEYSFEYVAKGKLGDDPGLIFESLDTGILEVNENGDTLYTYANFEGLEAEARMRVSSKYDEDFEKIFTFKVKKVFPESFKVSFGVPGYGNNPKTLKVGTAVYPYSYTEEKNVLNDYRIVYNDEYFTYDAERSAYIAIKATEGDEKVFFSAVRLDGKTANSAEFSICESDSSEYFDEIRINDEACESIDLLCGKSITPLLYKDGEKLSTSVDISVNEPNGVSVSRGYSYSFRKAGDYTLTFTLPGGFSRTLSVTVRNVMGAPSIVGSDDGKTIMLNDDESSTVKLSYPDGVTYVSAEYECDSDIITITPGARSFSVTPNAVGRATVKIILDDGYERIEETYVISVAKKAVVKTPTDKFIATFVFKVLGHTLMFAVLGALTVNLFKYIVMKNIVIKTSLYFASVLPTAVSTELIQTMQPGRYPRFKDVLIDMLGFLIGTAITVLVICLVKKPWKKTAAAEAEIGDGDSPDNVGEPQSCDDISADGSEVGELGNETEEEDEECTESV